MRVSGALILLAILLFGVQVGFSDGAMPRIAALPIGMVPVMVGGASLIAGLTWGLITGNGEYRAAIGLATLGTWAVAFAFQFATTGGGFGRMRPAVTLNEIALLVGGLIWLVALVLGAHAIRRNAARR